jgi:hypothetical protein
VIRRRYGLSARALVAVMFCLASAGAHSSAAAASAAPAAGQPCRFITAPLSPAAFCETFNRAMRSDTRSGQLDGRLWGVSRVSSANGPAHHQLYAWAAVRRDTCGKLETVEPEHDVAVCDHQAVEAVNDNGNFALLAMYPRQPFDFAGRTGTVEFEVSDDTRGPGAAWPAFLITDQPVPAPYSAGDGVADHAHDSIGFTLAAVCGQFGCGGADNPLGVGTTGFGCVGVDSVFETVNYQERTLKFNTDGCVLPSKALGSDNHFEVQVNASGVQIYGSDPGAPQTTRLIADASFEVPLTRGLIWLEDVHRNGGQFAQQSNTFSWGDVAFDGPILARDLGFDVLDNAKPGPRARNGLPTINLGYLVPGHHALKLEIRHVSGLAHALGSLLELTCWTQRAQTIRYSLNGQRWLRFPWPFGKQPTYVSQTVAMPVPLSELRSGTNTLRLSTTDPQGIVVANIDLILRGAGGIRPPP